MTFYYYSKGNKNSIFVLKKGCLDLFASLSGLNPNPQKSNVFLCGVPTSIKNEILDILQFNEVSLLIRYLGVPLISSRFWRIDCKLHVDRIIVRVKDWNTNDLSYAGRVLLAKVVLYSIQTYWLSLFILPITVTKEVGRIIRSFIWKGEPRNHKGAKIAWKEVCLPLPEGGLGLADLETCNRDAMTKHIWHILSADDQSP